MVETWQFSMVITGDHGQTWKCLGFAVSVVVSSS